ALRRLAVHQHHRDALHAHGPRPVGGLWIILQVVDRHLAAGAGDPLDEVHHRIAQRAARCEDFYLSWHVLRPPLDGRYRIQHRATRRVAWPAAVPLAEQFPPDRSLSNECRSLSVDPAGMPLLPCETEHDVHRLARCSLAQSWNTQQEEEPAIGKLPA